MVHDTDDHVFSCLYCYGSFFLVGYWVCLFSHCSSCRGDFCRFFLCLSVLCNSQVHLRCFLAAWDQPYNCCAFYCVLSVLPCMRIRIYFIQSFCLMTSQVVRTFLRIVFHVSQGLIFPWFNTSYPIGFKPIWGVTCLGGLEQWLLFFLVGMASAAAPAQPQFIVHAQSLQFTQGSTSDQMAGWESSRLTVLRCFVFSLPSFHAR